MNIPRILFSVIAKPKEKVLESLRNFHLTNGLNERPLRSNYNYDRNSDGALFFTNLPREKKSKKPKSPKHILPRGNLLIECKNANLNHYTGMHYGKFDVVPLVSKGWHHRKSYGDYFTILPSEMHSAFLTKEDLPDTFEEIGVSSKLIEQLKKIDVGYPTAIQAKAIINLLQGHNVFISGECGSGKTLAYVIALIENILKWKNEISTVPNAPLGIILLPTRELALQVGVLAKALGSDLGVDCHTLIGGDIEGLISSPSIISVDILICTLRVLKKHLKANLFSTKICRHIVIDESDTFMDDSFKGELKSFMLQSGLNCSGLNSPFATPNIAQMCFVSATVPSQLETSLSEIIKGQNMVNVSTPYLHKPLVYAKQVFRRVSKLCKPEELLKVVKRNVNAKNPTMIFCNRVTTAYWLNNFLTECKVDCCMISQQVFSEDRLRNYRDFEAGITNVIVCTDVGSRGLDFRKVKHVINYEFPTFMIDYIHRCGRTGRIGQGEDCVVTSFISSKGELPLLQKIEMAVRTSSTLPNIYQNRILQNKGFKKL